MSAKDDIMGGGDIGRLRRMVDSASDMTEDARQHSELCRDYYDRHQLTAAELSVLKKRKQPALVINRIRRKIDAMVGIEQKGRVDPRALPRNPQDEEAADIATKALVFVDDITRFDVIRSAFCYNLAIEGYGGVEVAVKQRNGQIDPDLIRLRWEEIFFDGYSRELDFSDAEYMGVQKWMALDSAIGFCRNFGTDLGDEELKAMLEQSMTNSSGSTYDDRPSSQHAWGDPKQKRVKLAYMYYKQDGGWRRALICGGGVIADEVSPYLDYSDDAKGVPSNAIILQGCYIDRENRRYGIVTDMIPMQDEINKRRSKLLHQLNSRQTMGAKGAVDVPLAKRELALPDGHVQFEQDPMSSVPSFQVIPQDDQIAGQFSLLQESKNEIDMLGPNASLLGQLEGQQSGRAIIAQQQAGMAELAPFYDSLRDWTLRVYRAMWCRIRQFWQEPRWIRVTDEQEKLQFIGINQPTIDPMTGQPGVQNEVGTLDVDIIIDMTPEYASLQMEEFNSLVELAKSGMVQIPPDVLIEASQLRNKQKLLEKLNPPGQEDQAAQQQQMLMQQAQQAMQLQMQEMQQKIAKLAAEAENKQADTMLKQAQTEKLAQETALAPIEMQADMADRQAAQQREGVRLGEDVRSGRVGEAREGERMQREAQAAQVAQANEQARMQEEFRAGQSREELERQKLQAAARNPAARG